MSGGDPQFSAVESEQAILGSVMRFNELAPDVLDVLSPDDFASDAHREVLKSLQNLVLAGMAIDPITVEEELKRRGSLAAAGGRRYLLALSDCGFSKNLCSYIARVLEASARRRIETAVRTGAGAGEISALARGLDAITRGSWERPTPFLEFQLPPFPVSALPGWLRDYVQALAESTQTPADLAAMMSLSVCAAACGKRVVVRVRPDYTEPVNLYTLTIMDSGTRKTAVGSDTAYPLRAQEEIETQRLAPRIAEAENRRAILEQRLRQLRQDAAKEREPSKRDAMIAEAGEVTEQIGQLQIPSHPRLVADDATPERIAVLLEQQGGRLAVLSAEGTIFDILAGLYTAHGTANLDVFLKAHAGEDLHVDRMNRPPVFVKNPALTMGLSAQPEVLRGLLRNQTFRGRGLVARFLFSIPRTLLGSRKVDPEPMADGICTRYQARILDLLALSANGVDAAGRPIEHELILSEAARAAWISFLGRHEPRLHPLSGDLAHLTDWAGKLPGAVIRIAGLLHAARHAEKGAPWKHAIEHETMIGALVIGDYLVEHAKAAFSEMGADPEVENAKHVLAWITRQADSNLSERAIFQGTRGRFRRMDALRPALNLLVEHGHLRRVDPPARTGRGRPSGPTFDVNPHVWGSSEDIVHFEHREEKPGSTALQAVDRSENQLYSPNGVRTPDPGPIPQNPQYPQNAGRKDSSVTAPPTPENTTYTDPPEVQS